MFTYTVQEYGVFKRGRRVEYFSEILELVGGFVWGPVMLAFFMGTGIVLTVRLKFLPWRNLGYALKSCVSKEARSAGEGEGDISPFSTLTTILAATLGTGNIVGVATAMVLGGPGALVWMLISSCFGITTAYAECMLSVKYREVNERGEMSGGPMYTIQKAFRNKQLGKVLSGVFAVFAILASFGMGNMTQANSISMALKETFQISEYVSGVVITILALVVIVGGIQSISGVSQIMVPVMAILYLVAGVIAILFHMEEIPQGLVWIFRMAFTPEAAAGGAGGLITVTMMQSMRWGVSRGVFSNEAGLGSAGITAAAAKTDHPVRQGYISMTGVFFDTIVICTITGLVIACSGVLGTLDAAGELLTGSALTIAAFATVFGKGGAFLICIGIVLFAFATILAWEYNGEKAFEYLVKDPQYCIYYRIAYSMICYIGATSALQAVWDFSDIANGLMAVPNLLCLLILGKTVAKDTLEFQKIVKEEKNRKKEG